MVEEKDMPVHAATLLIPILVLQEALKGAGSATIPEPDINLFQCTKRHPVFHGVHAC